MRIYSQEGKPPFCCILIQIPAIVMQQDYKSEFILFHTFINISPLLSFQFNIQH